MLYTRERSKMGKEMDMALCSIKRTEFMRDSGFLI